MSRMLHRPELEKLVMEIAEIFPIAGDWLLGMGFCPEALGALAKQCGREAITWTEQHGRSLENVIGDAYLAGFTLGVLAEREIER